MEDCNALAADCIVISCCCQCLIIQVLIFILLKLPYKLVRKTKEYARKKLRKRKKLANVRLSSLKGRFRNEFSDCHDGSFRIQLQGELDCGNCMEEVERVLEELSQRGEFAFGSLWGRETSGSSSRCVATQDLDFSLVRFKIVELTMVSSCRS